MKRTPRPARYAHTQAAYERAQEHALVCGRPTMEEMKARIKTPRTVRLEPMAVLAAAVARAASRKDRR